MGADDIKGWMTVNGAHIPLGENGEPTGEAGSSIKGEIAGKPSKPFSEDLKENSGNHMAAAMSFYDREYKGGHVVANFSGLGEREVKFTGGQNKAEIKKNMKGDPVKAELVQHLPDIIKTGKHLGSLPSYKADDHFEEYHYFQKKVDLGGKTANAVVDVGRRKDGAMEYNLYSLNHGGSKYFEAKKAYLRDRGLIVEDRKTADSPDVKRLLSFTHKRKPPLNEGIIRHKSNDFNIYIAEELPGGGSLFSPGHTPTQDGESLSRPELGADGSFKEMISEIMRKATARSPDAMAFDSTSKRAKDSNGFLRVSMCHVSKEGVNPYCGREVPGWADLGLDPDRIYYGYRPGDELAKAAASFNGVPLLFEHHQESAEDPQKEFRVGSLGTDAVFSAPYLDNSLIFTDAAAIAAVERGEYPELSAAYRYRPEFAPGVFQGIPYDFVMRGIEGNHVAIVREGRAGPDVVVADAQIENKEEISIMDKIMEALSKIADLVRELGVQPAAETEGLAANEDSDAALEAAAGGEEEANPAEADSVGPDFGKELFSICEEIDDEAIAGKIKAIAEQLAGKPVVGDEEKEGEPAAGEKKEAPVMDAALIRRNIEAAMRDKQAAARSCAPLIGDIVDPFAFDSADDIYKKALEIKGIDTKGYAPSAYKGMIDMLRRESAPAAPVVALDAAADKEFEGHFAALKNIKIA